MRKKLWRLVNLRSGMAEAGGQGGRTPPRFWQNRRGHRAAAHSAPHYYLPTQIFRPCAIPVIHKDIKKTPP